MNISYNWLKKYITTNLTAEEIAKILTSIGLEVGCVEEVESIKGGLKGLVVGEVLTCVNHENSDHLHVTTVTIGQEPLQIVCGAPNVAAGQKVIVATIGTVLYSGEESFTIKKSKIRGVESFGMICAEDEIGVGKSHDGIMVLPNDTPVGMEAKDYFHIENDTLIEVDITPNRSDATSHYGVARDLAAYCHAHGIDYKLTKPSVDDFKIDNHSLEIKIDKVDATRCPRYSGITVTNATVKESPDWLKNALQVIGLRPINNVVDATNYILHAFGQPLHAFDADKIKGGKIDVCTVAEGTKFVTLDGVERNLNAEDLMICNAEEPMCIGGVFGGLDSGVTENTKNIFIESAYFNPVSIRKTAHRFGLNTDASFRYERGIDPHNTIYVLKYAAMLIKELTGGEISSDIQDIYPNKIDNFSVTVTLNKIQSLIGKNLEEAEIERILEGLEIQIISKENGTYKLEVPAYRVDVQRDVDVIEDILRIYGYNNVEINDKLNSNLIFSKGVNPDKCQNLISEQLTASGFNEILNNSLTKSSYYEHLDTYPAKECVRIMNSLSADLNVMRQTLLFGGLESINRNANRQMPDLKFYEFGNCYHYHEEKKCDDPSHMSAYSEEYHLGLWITGNKTSLNWSEKSNEVSFYQLKAYVHNILTRMGVNIMNTKTKEISNEIYTQALVITTNGEKELATIGIISPKLLKQFDIENPVYYADIQWKQLLKEYGKHKISYTELSKFPEVKRDLALLIDKSVEFKQIESIAFETEKKLLKSVTLFDVYEGKNLEAGKKSYAVNFTLQDKEKTLTDKQIDAIMQKLIKALTEKLNAKLR